uniref:Pentatricopeptide repeat-containing protein At5g15340, mitochondrial n=1 Tax=Anthurium amnicola TaxID=1678845 RepID=A0A1D1ZEE4_9ARAE
MSRNESGTRRRRSIVEYARALLRSCGRRGHSSAHRGQKLHAALLKNGLLLSNTTGAPSSSLCGALFHMYASCGSPAAALRAFQAIPFPQRTPVDWTALLSSHSRHALYAHVLRLFRAMEMEHRVPGDEVTMVCVLGACARLRHPAFGAALHLRIIQRGLPFNAPTGNALMHMYANCGRMAHARKVFDEMANPTVVSWTVILSGALRWEGLDSARLLFDLMGERNEVTWTVMVAGYVEAGLPRDALALLAQMLFCLVGPGFDPAQLNHVTLCSILSSCSQSGDLTVGRWVHAHTTKMTTGPRVIVDTALVDMYAKCGRIDTARSLFERMPSRNIVTWNAMLSGLAMHGLVKEVLRLFSRMVQENVQPDDITFVSLLSACSRSGLLDEGRRYFRELGSVYGVTPQVEHYACMVDLLGRAGHLEEAVILVRSMPIPPNQVVLGSLLASCNLHGRVELGRSLLVELVQMDPLNTQYHVLLSNMLASSGKPAEADTLREVLRRRGCRKAPGVSCINVDGYVHQFCAGDKSHPLTPEIYAMLDEMVVRLRSAGYAPDAASRISRVMDNYLGLGDADETEERELALFSHSERLAIAFGLISTRPGSALLVFKNIRICSDCHAAVKLISHIYKRDITIRDRNRFHYFKQGSCSCSDYW